MIVFELTGSEGQPEYRRLEQHNLDRQIHFLQSLVITAVNLDRKFISQSVIKAMNFHAIACLHVNAGEYRPCEVVVGTGENTYTPPQHYRVEAMMDDFVNLVNVSWNNADPILLSAYVLWKLNYIHPFINGNGRTARACCYFVVCVKSGGLLPGTKILPQLLKEHRSRYVDSLKFADNEYENGNSLQEILTPTMELIRELLSVQMETAHNQ